MVGSPPKPKTADGKTTTAGKKTVRLSVPQKGFTFIASLQSLQFRNVMKLTAATLILFQTAVCFLLTAWGPRPTVKVGQKTSTVAEKGQVEEALHRRDTSTPPRRPPSSASLSPRSPTAAGPSSLHNPPSKTHTHENQDPTCDWNSPFGSF